MTIWALPGLTCAHTSVTCPTIEGASVSTTEPEGRRVDHPVLPDPPIEDPLNADRSPVASRHAALDCETPENDDRPASRKPVAEKGLAGFAQRLATWTERWFPDAFIFALIGVAIVVIGVIINGLVSGNAKDTPRNMFLAFGDGFWDLLAFSLQMAMVVLTGYVVATSRPIRWMIERMAHIPKTAKGAVGFVACLSMSVSFFSWGLSLVFSGLLARAIARRKDMRVDYRAIGAASFMGLGAIWALGISSSAAQLQATPKSIPPDLLKITGVLSFHKTIFTWQALLTTGILILLTTIIAWWSAPRDKAAVTAEQMGVDLDDSVDDSDHQERPGEYLEFKWWLPAMMGLLTLGFIGYDFWRIYGKQSTTGALRVFDTLVAQMGNLNGYLMVFLMFGLVLHGTPRRFMHAVAKAVPSTAGVLVQFPLYAVMAKLLTMAPGPAGGYSLAHHLSVIFESVGQHGFPLALAVYTALLGILVPSGGGKWIVEAPYVMGAATELRMNLGWTVMIYNIAEALPNLVNPFFMLPLLAILKVRARDLVGYTFVQFLFHLPVILLLVWALAWTFGFEPPVIPR